MQNCKHVHADTVMQHSHKLTNLHVYTRVVPRDTPSLQYRGRKHTNIPKPGIGSSDQNTKKKKTMKRKRSRRRGKGIRRGRRRKKKERKKRAGKKRKNTGKKNNYNKENIKNHGRKKLVDRVSLMLDRCFAQ